MPCLPERAPTPRSSAEEQVTSNDKAVGATPTGETVLHLMGEGIRIS